MTTNAEKIEKLAGGIVENLQTALYARWKTIVYNYLTSAFPEPSEQPEPQPTPAKPKFKLGDTVRVKSREECEAVKLRPPGWGWWHSSKACYCGTEAVVKEVDSVGDVHLVESGYWHPDMLARIDEPAEPEPSEQPEQQPAEPEPPKVLVPKVGDRVRIVDEMEKHVGKDQKVLCGKVVKIRRIADGLFYFDQVGEINSLFLSRIAEILPAEPEPTDDDYDLASLATTAPVVQMDISEPQQLPESFVQACYTKQASDVAGAGECPEVDVKQVASFHDKISRGYRWIDSEMSDLDRVQYHLIAQHFQSRGFELGRAAGQDEIKQWSDEWEKHAKQIESLNQQLATVSEERDILKKDCDNVRIAKRRASQQAANQTAIANQLRTKLDRLKTNPITAVPGPPDLNGDANDLCVIFHAGLLKAVRKSMFTEWGSDTLKGIDWHINLGLITPPAPEEGLPKCKCGGTLAVEHDNGWHYLFCSACAWAGECYRTEAEAIKAARAAGGTK